LRSHGYNESEWRILTFIVMEHEKKRKQEAIPGKKKGAASFIDAAPSI